MVVWVRWLSIAITIPQDSEREVRKEAVRVIEPCLVKAAHARAAAPSSSCVWSARGAGALCSF
eukprot:5009227-Alexandrium_andersonii.AAC.1